MAILAVVVLAVAGCTQSTQTTQNRHNTPPPSGSPSGPFAAGSIPTGVQLGHLLAHAQLQGGWTLLVGGGPQETDTGKALHPAYGPQQANDGCSIMNSSVSVLYFTNWWSVSDASLSIQGPQSPGNIDEPIMDLTAAAFRPAGNTAKTLSMAARLAVTCRSFNDHGSQVTVSSAPVPHLGSQGLYIKSTEQSSDGPIVAQVVLAQVGSYVVGANTNNATSADISQTTLESMVSWLVTLLQSG